MKNSAYIIAITTMTLFLSACGGPFSDYSDQDLRKEFGGCNYSTLSPAGAQRCRNIEKECEKRKEDRGFRC